MPPQPLSNVRTDAKFQVHKKATEFRPQLAPFIARIISQWALVEAGIGTMLSSILEAEFAATAAILSSLRSSSAQIDALAAAGRTKLSGRDLELFEAVIMIVRSAAKKRNLIAHHIWAYSDDLPDALLLVEPKAYAQIHVKFQTSLATKTYGGSDTLHPSPEHVRVYRKQDFEEIVREIDTVNDSVLITCFHLDQNIENDFYDELCSEPLVARALARVRKGD